MAGELVENIEVTPFHVKLQFGMSIKVTSITNEKFAVTTNGATPSTVEDPFVDIAVNSDYNAVGRTLMLYWNDDVLEPETEYILEISDLLNVLGQDIPDWSVRFTTGESVNTDDDNLPAPIPEVTIVDYSVISDAYDDLLIDPVNRQFSIDSVDPFNGDYYLPGDYNKGRITITFTQAPANDSVNSTNFKVQKREIKRGPSRWETIDAQISQSGTKVYIDLPSTDHYPEAATPSTEVVYFTAGYEYFEPNYKYRIIVSKNVTS